MEVLTKENLVGAKTAPAAISRTLSPLERSLAKPSFATLTAWYNPRDSRIAPKSIGEGASSLFGGWPGSPEN